jgi:hypothetical protein
VGQRDDGMDGGQKAGSVLCCLRQADRPRGQLTIEQNLPGNMSGHDWAIMREIVNAVKTAVPDAANRPAGQVFSNTCALNSLTDRIYTIPDGSFKAV